MGNFSKGNTMPVNKALRRYFMLDDKGLGIYYIQGSIHKLKMSSWEHVQDITSFRTIRELKTFAEQRNIAYTSIQSIRILIGDVTRKQNVGNEKLNDQAGAA